VTAPKRIPIGDKNLPAPPAEVEAVAARAKGDPPIAI